MQGFEITGITTAERVWPIVGNTGHANTPVDIVVKVPEGGVDVRLGDSSVTGSAGFPVLAGESIRVTVVQDSLWVAALSSATVYVLAN